MAEETQKKIILSGIQPTGVFTLGNYLGAVKGWKDLQEEYNCYYCIADLHSLTIRIDPVKRRQQTRQAFALPGRSVTDLTSAGESAAATNLAGSSDQTMMSIFSPCSSFTTAPTLAPRVPTQAPTGSMPSCEA